MILHSEVQGSPEWLRLRANYDTASEASAMMGESPYVKRSELMKGKATGAEKEFSEWVQENLLDKGHAIEEKAREYAQILIGEELYPCVGSGEEEGTKSLLASLDGLTMNGSIAWECKSWNKEKAEWMERNGTVPPADYWQVVQQLVVSRAVRLLYMVTDGEGRNEHIWVELNPDDEKRLIMSWEQFNKEKAGYTMEAVEAEVVAEAVEDLPAVFVQVSGQVRIQDNFSTFEKALRHFLDNTLIRDPETDQDFANLDTQIKAMQKAEAALANAESQMLAQVQEVNDLKRTKDMLHKLVRDNRLASEKLLKAQKEQIKLDIRSKAEADLKAHITSINATLVGAYLPPIQDDFAGAMKNKRTLSSLRDAVNTELARLLVEANSIADSIRANLEVLRGMEKDYEFLFRDRQELVLKDRETLVLIVKSRIEEHKKVEAERLERQEEERRLERERIDRENKERAEREEREEAIKAANKMEAIAADSVEQAAPQIDYEAPPLDAYADDPAATEEYAWPVNPVSVRVGNLKALLNGVISGEVPASVISVDTDALLEVCKRVGRPLPGCVLE